MVAPYLLNQKSVVGWYFRNAESESAWSIVWKRGGTYSFEYYEEYFGSGTIDPSSPPSAVVINDFTSTELHMIRAGDGTDGGTKLFWKNNFTQNGLADSGVSTPIFFVQLATPTKYFYGFGFWRMDSRPFSWSSTLDRKDAVDGISFSTFDFTQTVSPGSIWGGSGGFVNGGTGGGQWLKGTFAISSDCRLGQAWAQMSYSKNRQLSPVYMSPGDTRTTTNVSIGQTGFNESLMVQIQEADWVDDTTEPGPNDRPYGYDPDAEWDGGWVNPNTLTTLGGGRYGKQIVAVGHKKLYYGSL